MNNNNKTICGSCKHFHAHYYFYKERLKTTQYGHCTGRRFKKCILSNTKACEKWETNEELAVQQKQNIESTLKFMARQINDISLLLYIDK